jgi:hypothetical protein
MVNEELIALRAMYDAAEWAHAWDHNIVPPGKPAHELACAAVRALPALFAALAAETQPVARNPMEQAYWDATTHLDAPKLVTVPVDPTPAMIDAGEQMGAKTAQDIWKAMVGAALKETQPVAGGEQDSLDTFVKQVTAILLGTVNAPEQEIYRVSRQIAELAKPTTPERAKAMEDRFWLVLQEPGRIPERKGPWKHSETARILREFMAARPTAYIHVLTLGDDGTPHVDHGPEVLQTIDGRSMSTGRAHNQRVRKAHAAALSASPPEVVEQ